jgi:hypothetical protein
MRGRGSRHAGAGGAAPGVCCLAVRRHELQALTERVDRRLACPTALGEAPDQLADLREGCRGWRGAGGVAGACLWQAQSPCGTLVHPGRAGWGWQALSSGILRRTRLSGQGNLP